MFLELSRRRLRRAGSMDAPTTEPLAPIAASAAACSWRGTPRRGHRSRRPRASGEFRPALLQGLGARRNGRPRRPAARSRKSTAGARVGTRRSILSPRPFHGQSPSMDRTAVAFYVSGQLLTEDYYVANKLMKGFIGSANIDTNSRLCMASSVPAHRRAFGADTVPGLLRRPRTGRSGRSCRLQSRLVPSGALSADRGGEAASGRRCDRAHRSAPDDDRRYCGHAPARSAGRRCRTVQRPARVTCREERSTAPSSPRHTNGFDERSRTLARALSLDEIAAQSGVPAEDAARILRAVRAHRTAS